MADKLAIIPWSHGADPEDFGWLFQETGFSLCAFDIGNAADRDEAADLGIPASVLDAYAADGAWGGPDDDYGYGLLLWLQAGW